jgi:hypothetical protein
LTNRTPVRAASAATEDVVAVADRVYEAGAAAVSACNSRTYCTWFVELSTWLVFIGVPEPAVTGTVESATAYAARGVSANVSVARVKVSPFTIDFATVRAAVKTALPVVIASQSLMCEIVSEPDAHVAHVGVFEIDFDPADAAFQVADTRVVFADGAVAAAAPGSAVWSLMKDPAIVVNAVPPTVSSQRFARKTAIRPTAMPQPS